MAIILKIDHLAYSYYSDIGEVNIIENLDFSIPKGSFTAIVGPSGCGKSTILSLIAGLLSPSNGFITLYSDDFSVPKVGYMLQHDHLLEWRNVYHNVILGLEIQHKMTNEHLMFVDELLEKYHLSHTKQLFPSELSGGMRQRIALIRTLALKPDLLLLDEPFSALDYQTRLLISHDVRQIIKTENKTALLVTHDIAEAISMADCVLLLSKTPCKIKLSVPIDFEKYNIPREKVRESKLFQDYFDFIWKELQNENIPT